MLGAQRLPRPTENVVTSRRLRVARVVSQSKFRLAPAPSLVERNSEILDGRNRGDLQVDARKIIAWAGIVRAPFAGLLADDQSPLVLVGNGKHRVTTSRDGFAANGDISGGDERGGFIRAQAPHFAEGEQFHHRLYGPSDADWNNRW